MLLEVYEIAGSRFVAHVEFRHMVFGRLFGSAILGVEVVLAHFAVQKLAAFGHLESLGV